MKRLACVSITTFVLCVFLVHQGSPATRNELITALDAYEKAIVDKLNSDLEIIARAFFDANDIQEARRWADLAKLPLSIISFIIGLPSTIIESPGDVLRDLVRAEGQLELITKLFSLNTIRESIEGYKLAINGPEYNEIVSAMLAEADDVIKEAYQNIILLYLHGLRSGRKSPVPVVISGH